MSQLRAEPLPRSLNRCRSTTPGRSLSRSAVGHNIGAETRMPRFPLPDKFSDGDVIRFKKSFNRIAKANGWSEEERLFSLPLCLQGRALIAFEKDESSFTSVDDAFKALEVEFGSLDKDNAIKEFYSCSWGLGLDIDVYAQNLLRLSNQGLPSLGDDDRDRMVVKQFFDGFPSEVSKNLRLIFSGRTPILTEAVAAAKGVICEQGTVSGNSASLEERSIDQKVEEMSEKLQTIAAQVAAMASETRVSKFEGSSNRAKRRLGNRNSVRCFNCSGYGHLARQCPSSRINQGSRSSGNGATAGRELTPDPQ